MNMKKTFLLCTSLCATVAFAQPPAAPADAATAPGQPAMAATGAMAQAPAADADFVKKAAVGGMFEVQSSQMATTASQNADVKAFAQQMVTDHTAANQELMTLASSKGMQVPASLDQPHAQMIQRLSNAKGEQFDKTYVRQQMRAHMEALKLFQTAASSATDPDIKAFAQKTLPVLQQHAEKAKSLPGANEGGADAGGKKKGKGNKKAKDGAENSSSNSSSSDM